MRDSPKRICYLASAANIHTKKWASHFAGRGYDVHVLSLHAQREEMAALRERTAVDTTSMGAGPTRLMRDVMTREELKRRQAMDAAQKNKATPK